MAKRAGLPWDCVLSSELAHHYKPDPEVYLLAAQLLGLEPHQVMMVAAHNGDLLAAQAVGCAEDEMLVASTGVIGEPGETWTSQRDHLLLVMLYNTGARVSEMIGVNVGDVVLDELEAVDTGEVGDVVGAPGDEVVDADDLVAARDAELDPVADRAVRPERAAHLRGPVDLPPQLAQLRRAAVQPLPSWCAYRKLPVAPLVWLMCGWSPESRARVTSRAALSVAVTTRGDEAGLTGGCAIRRGADSSTGARSGLPQGDRPKGRIAW